jgi:hypothetical protein
MVQWIEALDRGSALPPLPMLTAEKHPRS